MITLPKMEKWANLTIGKTTGKNIVIPTTFNFSEMIVVEILYYISSQQVWKKKIMKVE